MVIKVKLKRKLSYKGHYEYQFVNPLHVQEALKYLKEHNSWYSEIDTIEDCICKDLDMEETSLDAETEQNKMIQNKIFRLEFNMTLAYNQLTSVRRFLIIISMIYTT